MLQTHSLEHLSHDLIRQRGKPAAVAEAGGGGGVLVGHGSNSALQGSKVLGYALHTLLRAGSAQLQAHLDESKTRGIGDREDFQRGMGRPEKCGEVGRAHRLRVLQISGRLLDPLLHCAGAVLQSCDLFTMQQSELCSNAGARTG